MTAEEEARPCDLVVKIFPKNCNFANTGASMQVLEPPRFYQREFRMLLGMLRLNQGRVIVLQRHAEASACSTRFAFHVGKFEDARQGPVEPGHWHQARSANSAAAYEAFKKHSCNGTQLDDAARRTDLWFSTVRRWLDHLGKPYLNVSFEENTQRHEETMGRVGRFLAQ